MRNFARELRFAARMLSKNPAFAALAVLVLALGIGANSAIFSVVNAALLRPLPYHDPGRLVLLWGNVQRSRLERRGASYPDFLDWRKHSASFESVAAFWNSTFTLYGADAPERVKGEVVSSNYFPTLGVTAVQGRTFRPEEDVRYDLPPVAVVSQGFWARHFGSDQLNGQILNLDSGKYTITGIMAPGFHGISDEAEVWVPATMIEGAASNLAERGSRWFAALARLKTGVSVKQAQAELDGISKALEQAYPNTNSKRAVEVAPFSQEILGDIRPALLVILGAVSLVLLIACANVANLLLAKAESRQKEVAIRTALGASRGDLLRQLLAESFLLTFAGASCGLVLSYWGVRTLMAASPVKFPSFVDAGIDLQVIGFTLIVSVLTATALGFAPAFHSSVGRLGEALKDASGRISAGAMRQRFRSALVVSEVALALVLLTGAGLLIRTFRELSRIDPGFKPDHLLSMRIGLPRIGLPNRSSAQITPVNPSETAAYARRLLTRIQALPGIQSASLGSDIPLGGDDSAIFFTAEGQSPVTTQNRPRAYVHRVAPGFFSTLGIPLVQGSDFLPSESDGVAIISESAVKRFWPSQNPIGRLVKGGGPESKSPWLRIVGVAAETKYRGLPANPTSDPDLYLPLSERARQFALFVRTGIDPGGAVHAVRQAIQELDKTASIYNVAVMSDRVGEQFARARFTSWLMGIFSGVALLLTLVGVYGVMAYSITQRTNEIGIRLALGAERRDVLRLMLGRGLGLVGIGIAVGSALALAATRLLRTLLFGVTASDPVTFAGVASLLVLTAIVAIYIPARKAMAIDPVTALKYE